MLALEFITSKGLRPYMFHELRDGVVRLDPDLAKPLAETLMPKMHEPIMAEAALYAAELRRINVPYRLPRFARRRTGPNGPFVAPQGVDCGYCHKPLPKKGLKFCSRHCYLRYSVDVRQPIKLAQQRLAEMRAQGLDPGHGGEAAKIRGAKLAQSNRRRAMNLTPDAWRERRAAQERLRRRGKR
jgi:hypothetical protein